MEQNKADQLIMIYGNLFPSASFSHVRDILLEMDYSLAVAKLTQLKDPTTALILSILAGHFGVDRFYIGDTGMGVGKLLTCGGLYIWWIVDMFLIMDATREKNYEQFLVEHVTQS